MKHPLFPLHELAPGEMRAAQVDKLSVVIVRKLDGSVRGLLNRCSHQGAKLSDGRVMPLVVGGDVGKRQLTEELVIRCPWHGFEFDLEGGRCVADPRRQRVRGFEVTVEDDIVILDH